MKHAEHDLQKSCLKWFKLQYPKEVIFAIPNGGKRDEREAARLKAEGVLSGVADLQILSNANSDAKGLFIEMKTKNGRQSDAQQRFEIEATQRGYNYAVARNLDEFIKIVKDFFN
ncbi:MAG: VRR-NUC domain-containing protein [Saprospiraceae bacterium]|nr:VRR-NUC domain-containing protein [Saprospiraceae bacterium]